MALDRVWSIKQFTFNSQTYNASNGGPLDWDYDDSSNEIGDRVANQIYASAVIIPERDLTVSIVMRDPYTSITEGTKSDIVFTFTKDADSADEVITFADMVFIGQRASGRKSIPATSTLMFRYEGTGTSRISRS